MKGLEAKTLGLRKVIRHEYKRIVAFMLTVAMVVTNFGTNLTVAFAAGEEESSLFLLNSSELEDAISTALESGDVFDFSSLELKAKQKSLKTSYEKLIGSKAGKVYQLDVDIDSSYATEHTDLQVFYNAGTDDVVFLFINESDMAVTFRANVSGYETARVTVNPNTTNIEDAEGVENAEDYSGTTMEDDEKKPQAEVVKPEGETSESESASDETEAAETEADVTESENASENGEAEETTGAEEAAETETSAAEETEAETEPETEAETPAEETEAEIELTPEEGSASASISAKKVFRVSTSAEAAVEAPAADAEEETEAETKTEAEEPEKETEAPAETTAEETVADDSTEETTAADETDGELTDETEAPTEDVTTPDETTGEQPADNGGSENIGFDGDEQFLEDDSIELAGELNGKAYNTVTIWGSANARAYVVKAEDLTGEAAVEGQYSVDYSVDPVGAATIKGAHTVNEGETLYFAVDPQVGYEITEVTANGEPLEEADAADVASASDLEQHEHVYAVEAVTEDLEIVASLEETMGVAHPEFSASYVSSEGVTISLHAEEGILPEGTELSVTEVTDALGDTIKEKMDSETEGTTVHSVLAYDINLLYNGKKLSNSWSESGYVDVTFTGAPIQEMTEASDKVEIVAVDDTSKTQLNAENAAEAEAGELKLETVSEQNVEDAAVEEVGFKAEHFTIYAVTGSGWGAQSQKLQDMHVPFNATKTIYSDKDSYNSQYYWESSDTSILTVSDNSRGLVKSTYRNQTTLTTKNKAGLVCVFLKNADGKVIDSASIWVPNKTTTYENAAFYYLLDPTKDANSNDTGNWGECFGVGTIDITNANWTNDKNEFNTANRVKSWPSGKGTFTNGKFELTEENAEWNQIFKNFKASVEEELGIEKLTPDDVVAIYLTPAKISKNNGTDPDKHVDCNVEIKAKNVVTVTVKLQDAGAPTFQIPDADKGYNLIKGNNAKALKGTYPAEKTVDGKKYKFVGWYTNENLSGTKYSASDIPNYEVNENTTFYAKYVPALHVNYDLNGGDWGNVAKQYSAFAGDTVTVVSTVPTRQGYEFAGWYDSVETSKKYGSNFEMPNHDVTLVARWTEKTLHAGYNLVLKEASWDGATPEHLTENGKTDGGAQKYRYDYGFKKGDTFTVTSNEPKADGYKFIGWFDKKGNNKKGVVYQANDVVTHLGNEEHTLDALWVGIGAKDVTQQYDGKNYSITASCEYNRGTLADEYVEMLEKQNLCTIGNMSYEYYDGHQWSNPASENPKFKDVGTYVVKVTCPATAGGKTVLLTKTATVTITPAPVTITAESHEFTYTGSAQTWNKYTVNGVISGEKITADTVGSITYPQESPVENRVDESSVAAGNDKTKLTNYTIAYVSGELTMKYGTPIVLHIEANSAKKVYDSEALKADGYTLTIGNDRTKHAVGADGKYTFGNGDVLQVIIAGSATNVSDTEDGNNRVHQYMVKHGNNDVTDAYSITTKNGKLTITPKQVTITAKNDDFKYDGKVHSNPDYDVDGLVGTDKLTATVAGSITYPSQSPVQNTVTGHEFTSGDEKNYTVEYKAGKLTMSYDTAVELKIVADSDEKPYDGTALTRNSYKLYIGGSETAETLKADGTYEFRNGDVLTVTIEGSATNVADTKDGNNVVKSYTIKHGAENVSGAYTVEKVNGKLAITPKQVTITAKDDNFKYDGKVHSNPGYDVDGLVGTDKLTATVAGSITYPSQSPVQNTVTGHEFTSGDEKNYTVEYKAGKLTMSYDTAVELKIVADSADKPYDGTALTRNSYKLYIGGSETAETLKADGTYEFRNGDVLTVTIEGSATNVADTKDGNNVVKSYTIKHGAENVSGAYTVEKVNGKLAITPKQVTITAKDDNFKYDGKVHSNPGYDVDGLVGTDKLTATVAGSITYPSQSPVQNTVTGHEFTSGDEKNYTVEYKAGKLTMSYDTAVELKIVADSADKPYDGTALTRNSYKLYIGGSETAETLKADGTYEFRNGDVLTVTIEGSATNVADTKDGNNVVKSYTIKHGAENVSGAYTVEKVNGKLAITPKQVTITAKDDNFKYDGKVHSNPGYDVDGLVGTDKLTATVAGSITYPSQSPVQNTVTGHEFTSGDEKNYTVEYKAGKLTMSYDTAVELKIVADSADKPYDGTALTRNSYKLYIGGSETAETLKADGTYEFRNGDVLTVTIEGSATNVADTKDGNNVVKSYTIKHGAENVSGAYTVEKVNGKLAITPKQVTITAKDDNFKYDGKVHSNPGYDVDGLVGTDKLTATVAGSITYPSQSPVQNTVTGHEFTSGDEKNYTVEYKAGKLTMSYDTAVELKIVADSADKPYDGTALTRNSYKLYIGGSETAETLKADGTYEFRNGDVLTVTIEGSATNVADTKDGNNVVKSYTIKHGAENVSGAYAVETENGTLAITKRVLTLKAASGKQVYDGTVLEKHELEGDPIGLVNGERVVIKSLAYIGQQRDVNINGSLNKIDVTSVRVEKIPFLRFIGSSEETTNNYQIETVDGRLIVTPRPVKITLYPESKFVGEEDPEFRSTVEAKNGDRGLIPGEELLYTVRRSDKTTSSAEALGTHVDVITVDYEENAGANRNYQIEFEPEDFNIYKADLEVGKKVTNLPVNGEGFVVGDVVQFEIVVKNVGNLPLSNIVVNDELPNAVIANGTGYRVENNQAIIDKLNVVETTTVLATYEVTAADITNKDFKNIATVTSKIPDPTDPDKKLNGPEVPAETEIIPTKGVKVEKTVTNTAAAADGKYVAGEKVTFDITVTNTGNTVLGNFRVVDQLENTTILEGAGYDVTTDAATGLAAVVVNGLAENASITIKAEHIVTEADLRKEHFKNVAVAELTDPQNPDNPKKEEGETPDIPKVDADANWKVTKTVTNLPSRGYFRSGETAEFDIKVENTGNQTLNDIVVADLLSGAELKAGSGYTLNADGTATIATLKVGETVVLKAAYTVTSADVTNKKFVNAATASIGTETETGTTGDIPTRTTGGGNSGGGGGGGSSSGPRDNGGSSSGGPGTTTVTIDPDAVPLANLPNEDGADNLLMIDDEDVPLAALPKTGQSGTNGLVFFLSSMMLAAFVAVTKKREDDK